MEIARHLLERSRRGLLFDDDTSRAVMPLMGKLIDARGVRRLGLFFQILDLLATAPKAQTLASLSFVMDMQRAEESDMNRALGHLRENLLDAVSETELADLTGQSQSAFSRSFKRHTGTTLVRYRNQMRIDLACHMLLSDPDAKVADICFDVGFSNLSNFNRHFLKLKKHVAVGVSRDLRRQPDDPHGQLNPPHHPIPCATRFPMRAATGGDCRLHIEGRTMMNTLLKTVFDCRARALSPIARPLPPPQDDTLKIGMTFQEMNNPYFVVHAGGAERGRRPARRRGCRHRCGP